MIAGISEVLRELKGRMVERIQAAEETKGRHSNVVSPFCRTAHTQELRMTHTARLARRPRPRIHRGAPDGWFQHRDNQTNQGTDTAASRPQAGRARTPNNSVCWSAIKKCDGRCGSAPEVPRCAGVSQMTAPNTASPTDRAASCTAAKGTSGRPAGRLRSKKNTHTHTKTYTPAARIVISGWGPWFSFLWGSSRKRRTNQNSKP